MDKFIFQVIIKNRNIFAYLSPILKVLQCNKSKVYFILASFFFKIKRLDG